MLEVLRFVQGAVAKKDLVPALTHFCIRKGTIKGFNGTLALSSPIDLDLDVQPRAVPFVKAIQACKETVALHVTPAGKLAVRSGKFRAYVDSTPEPFPEVFPEGELLDVPGELLPALRLLAPFISEDASRPWSRGILFAKESAYATNNIVLLEHWLGYGLPRPVNIPKQAVQELLRIGEEPASVQVTDNSATFHYEDGKWLRTSLLDLAWPDLPSLLEQPSDPQPVPEALFPALEDIAPFADDLERVYFLDGAVSTVETGDEGARVELAGLPAGACFNCGQLRKLAGLAVKADFSEYPKPCHFYGDRLRGVIVGVRA